jgi:hypothetical protein
MEDDRAQVDLGIAVDVEERLEEAAVQRQPKKRFVGRKAAEAAASRTRTNGNVEDSGAIEGKNLSYTISNTPQLITTSIKAKTDASDAESSPSRDPQRSRDQRCYCPPPSELLVRNTQDHPPHTDKWLEKSGSADA